MPYDHEACFTDLQAKDMESIRKDVELITQCDNREVISR
jgi:hypothetical protein